jgi:hypothetical protein
MANVKMGFEGLLYYGTAGSTASTLLENCKDITISYEVERGDTTVRGTGTTAPIKTGTVTQRMANIEFTMINDTTDTYCQALKTAAAAGTGIALRGKDYSSGKGPDADYTLSFSAPWPLNGEQAITFTAEPSRDYGRSPSSYV